MAKQKNKTTPHDNPQGIRAEGDTLRKYALTALGIALLPLLLGLTYLASLHQTGEQKKTITYIANSYAHQQASTVGLMFNRLETRLRGAAQSPLALSAISSQSAENIELVEQTMLDYFPEVVSLRILPLSELGTANLEGGTGGLRNHIEVDLVRRTANGTKTQPESYEFENNWLTSIAYLVAHPRNKSHTAVIIVTIDNKLIVEELNFLDGALGRTILQQIFTNNKRDRIFDIAHAGFGDATDYTQISPVQDTPWQISFTPSGQMLDDVSPKPWLIYALLGLLSATTIAAIGYQWLRSRKALAEDIDTMTVGANRHAPMILKTEEMVGIAKQLRRTTLRNLRQTASGDSEPALPEVHEDSYDLMSASTGIEVAEISDPMFQKDAILDVTENDDEVELELELDIAMDDEDDIEEDTGGLPKHIFRAYDIRGLADEELTDDLVHQIGLALGTIAEEQQQQSLLVASDARLSSNRIKNTLVKALVESGRDVIDLGQIPTPLLYFATQKLDYHSGVMITGSHNPAEYNGMKIVLNKQTIGAGGIQNIFDRIRAGSFSKGAGRIVREDVVARYLDEVLSDIAVATPLRVVIDAGNGITGPIAPALFEELGCEVIPLYCEPDGNFPNHDPDTGNEDNLRDLAAAVSEHDADFGVAFDGDGDRIAVVTNSGEIVRTDQLMMLFADDVVSRNPGTDVVFDVKCSRQLSQLISSKGGRPVLWKTGHAYMKEKMAETGALLGGEFSGHIFFGERWYGFDDGMYAACRLAEIIAIQGLSLDECLSEYPQLSSTPELLLPVDERYKFRLMNKIIDKADFAPGKVNTLDGVRVDYNEGWGLLRASNTGAYLTARFEAESAEALESIKGAFRKAITQADPNFDFTL